MKHRVFGRKLNRTSNERQRLFVNLSKFLILNGQITTTLAKAKAVQPSIEKMVSRAKLNTLANRRLLLKELSDVGIVNKLMKEIGPLFQNRNGGYTRIIKLGNRLGDSAKMVSFSFTEYVPKTVKIKIEKVKAIETGKKDLNTKVEKKKEKNAKDKGNKTK